MAEPAAVNRQAMIQRLPVARTARGLSIGAFDVVEYWETPIQETLASEAVRHGRRIFEVGYGLGICARKIASLRPDAHTIVEAHPQIASAAEQDLAATGSQVICSLWEDVLPTLTAGAWDVIVFDAYPLDGPGFNGTADGIVDMVAPALIAASNALRDGGKFLFLDFTTNVTISGKLRTAYEGLFNGGISTTPVTLQIPSDCTYAHGSTGEVVALLR